MFSLGLHVVVARGHVRLVRLDGFMQVQFIFFINVYPTVSSKRIHVTS